FMSAGEETMEEYIARWAEVICGWEIRDLAVQDGGTIPRMSCSCAMRLRICNFAAAWRWE
ncbi:hypothetical protein, partial [Pseudoflavonifractor phocaeensis]|uniref:hypothetical protein n=1 Tax=Pseudoflavonifractor phocaeensis TaxID=1870988 RepID=UPI00195A2846